MRNYYTAHVELDNVPYRKRNWDNVYADLLKLNPEFRTEEEYRAMIKGWKEPDSRSDETLFDYTENFVDHDIFRKAEIETMRTYFRIGAVVMVGREHVTAARFSYHRVHLPMSDHMSVKDIPIGGARAQAEFPDARGILNFRLAGSFYFEGYDGVFTIPYKELHPALRAIFAPDPGTNLRSPDMGLPDIEDDDVPF